MEFRLNDLSGDMRLIADALGLNAAQTLFEAFRGCVLYIPSKPPRETFKRYITEQHAAGKSCKQLAQQLGISERYIQMILAKQRLNLRSEPS